MKVAIFFMSDRMWTGKRAPSLGPRVRLYILNRSSGKFPVGMQIDYGDFVPHHF